MKSLNRTSLKEVLKSTVTLVVVLLVCINATFSQVPDCGSGTVMYSIWNDSISSSVGGGNIFKTSEIRSINYATGAVGPLVGGIAYTIQKTIGATTYYGSASIAVDGMTSRFYVNTQMGNAGGKDFISIDPVTATMVTIATTPSVSTANVPTRMPLGTGSGLDNYHFVKMAISPTGLGFAIGVLRDTTLAGYTAATCNPLISFTTCGVGTPITNCSTIKLLGFLQSTPAMMTNWQLFNGDIAFDNGGNLYFATAAFTRINGIGRYSNARLFKIDAASIPSTPGTGAIPMTFMSDYNTLDSTVINGIALDPLGKMYLTTRRFTGVQTSPVVTPFLNELYQSGTLGTATLVTGFGPHTAGYSIADIGSCYFPLAVLEKNVLKLSSKYASGNAELTWNVNDNNRIDYFEVQRSDDGENYATISRVDVISNNGHADQTYTYHDSQGGFGKPKFYRVREYMTGGGLRFYSNIVKVNFNAKIDLVAKPKPNPFISYVDFDVQLKNNSSVSVRLIDKSGRVLYNKKFDGHAGSNKITVNDFGHLPAGVYIAELGVDDEVVREKIIKNN